MAARRRLDLARSLQASGIIKRIITTRHQFEVQEPYMQPKQRGAWMVHVTVVWCGLLGDACVHLYPSYGPDALIATQLPGLAQ